MDMFLDEFRTQFGREPQMDYTALHRYDYGLEDQVNEIVMRYGNRFGSQSLPMAS